MNFSSPPAWLFLVALVPIPGFAIDWANPPVACIEDLVPRGLPCLDLKSLSNPILDLPPLTAEETQYWTVDHRSDLALCRAREVERRERDRPGSQSAGDIAWAWMWSKQVEDLDGKIHGIYDAAESADMPPSILFGALKQESLLANLGITADGANYSCGIGQINVVEWCEYMRTLPAPEQTSLGWPVGIACTADTLTPELVRPFYEIALRRLGTRPDYELTPREFADIRPDEVIPAFPAGTAELQRDRFRAVTSFVRECADVRRGIAAKGRELRRLFERAVPSGLKRIEVYARGRTPVGNCRRPYRSRYYPLHTGWLLADAIYNAGEREVSLLQHYFRMTKADHESGAAWRVLSPPRLIEGLHWGGKWNATTKKIEYRNVYGVAGSQSWFKSCVVQRHLARVIQYAALPGATIVSSLETEGCSQTKVPAYRKQSSGRIPAKKPPIL